MSGISLRRATGLATLVAPLAFLLTGCSEGYPPDLEYPARTDLLVLTPPNKEGPANPPPPGELDSFVATLDSIGGKTFDPKQVPAKKRRELERALKAIFGTPSAPQVNLTTLQADPALNPLLDNAESARATLLVGDKTLGRGAQHFRRHCLHCHGVSGDGRGPTGPWLYPHPRDYRQGTFKFISTSNDIPTRKARREDLRRTLEKGLEGTSMPAFALFGDKAVDDLTSYVIHLALRGETEYQVLSQFKDGDKDSFTVLVGDQDVFLDSVEAYALATAADLLVKWAACTTAPPNKPDAYPYDNTEKATHDSIRRGYKKFTEASGDAACLNCHADFGRQANYRYDVWGTMARPANLTVGTYRGGRRPIDIYWRVTGGIQGCGMPANKALTKEQYWDLVNFVQALPYPQMLPEDVRSKVYTPATSEKKEEKHTADLAPR